MIRTVLLVHALAGCAAPPSTSRPDVLLITLDTTRADALGVYGADPSPTPVLDALAARGALVREAMTVAPLTLPAHASLLSGLYPSRSGVKDNMSFRLPDQAETLAELLKRDGYRTGAFVAAAVLDKGFGLGQGFEAYSDGVARSSGVQIGIPRRDAAAVVDDAVGWLRGVPSDQPVFTWTHFYDAHLPLTPPERHLHSHPGDGYLAAVSYIDEQVGRLLDEFTVAGRDPIVVVVADHGESRGEHGELTHGWFVYRSTMRVPLLVAGPGVAKELEIPGPVSVVDIMPTLLELVGLAGPDTSAIDGRSFAPTLRGDQAAAAPRTVYGESWSPRYGFGFHELRVAQNGTHRFIEAPEPELYGWRDDPTESNNVADQVERLAPELREALEGHVAADVADATRAEPLDGGSIEMLEALGYVASAVDEPDDLATGMPDPKSAPDMIQRYDAVMLAARTRTPAEGIVVLEGFLREYPGAAPARLLLARGALLSGDHDRGLDALEPIAEHSAQAGLLRAQLLLAAGRIEDARGKIEELKKGWPAWSAPRVALAEHLRDAGDCETALREADAGLALGPDEPALLVVRGACLGEVGDLVGAERDLRRALELAADETDVRFELGVLLARTGRAAEAATLLVKAVELAPEHVQARTALGLAYYELGRIDEAVATLGAVVPVPESGAEAPLVLADMLLQLGRDLDEALVLLDLAETRDPDEAQVHAVRARVLDALGRADDARAAAATYEAARRREVRRTPQSVIRLEEAPRQKNASEIR